MRIQLLFFLILLLPCICRAQAPTPPANPAYEAAKELTAFRRQRRKTIDGRLCAAAFVYDGMTYTDCTDARGPGGSAGREWCFVEVSLLGKGPKDWNYCAPAVNYDKVRAKAREAFEIKNYSVEKMTEQLDKEVQRLEDMKRRFNTTCGGQHEATGMRLAAIENMTLRSRHHVGRLQETLSKVELLHGAVSLAEEELKTNRKSLLKQPENCQAIRGYEDDPYPDGLRGAYYDNPTFEGPPKTYRDDNNIDFAISGKSNIEGITPDKFSIRWDGFILIPQSGRYVFSTESTGGARVFLNDIPIIVDRMPRPSTIKEARDDLPVPIAYTARKAGIKKVDSAPQQLVGGQKLKIRVETIHSSHLSYDKPHESSMKLLWESANLEKEVIPKKYFFRSNMRPPLKISGLNADEFETTILFNGVAAYKDDEDHYVADLPERFEGRKLIRTVQPLTSDEFIVEINSPAIVYIASAANEPLPIAPKDGHNHRIHKTNEYVFVHEANSALIKAISSVALSVSFFEVRDGGDIWFTVLQKNKPFLLFLEPKKETENTCGGEEEVLSITDGPYFGGCEASSEFSSQYDCKAALSGKLMDQPNDIWRSTGGNGIGQYIIVKFKKDVQITEFRFKPRDDEAYWPSQITLSFTEEHGDDSQVFNIKHISSIKHNTFVLKKPVVTRYVKMEVTEMFTKFQDTGGSFELVGTPCNSRGQGDQGKQAYQHIKIEKCFASAEDTPEVLPLEDGQEFVAVCPKDCVSSPEGRVLGYDTYSPESSICASAIHAGVCKKSSKGPCKVLVTVGGPREYFNRGQSNGIFSTAAGRNEASLKFSVPSEQFKDKSFGSYNISFQKKNSMLPSNEYFFDVGGVKRQQREIFYGWLHSARLESCSEQENTSPLNSGGVAFPPITDCEYRDCETNFWSMTVPESGKYHIEIQVGSNCGPPRGVRMNYLQVNGIPTISAVPLRKGEYYWANLDLVLPDKKIMLTSMCDAHTGNKDLCKDAQTTLLNVRVKKIE